MSHYLLEAIRGAMELDSKLEQEAYPLSCELRRALERNRELGVRIVDAYTKD